MPTVDMSRRSRPRAAVWRAWRTSSTRSFIFLMRSRMTRRSVSSWLSPGPRDPMPPWVRERCVQSRVRRGSWYSSCASSTCSRPSCVRACWAKMPRISRLRSMTLTLTSSSSVRCCVGESSSSATRRSTPVSDLADTSSSALPLPTYQCGSTWRRFCHSAPTTSAPAVSARLASSARESSAFQPGSVPVSTATRKAFSVGRRARSAWLACDREGYRLLLRCQNSAMADRMVGIVGGVGPESTADYYRRFIDRWRVRGPADTYPAVLINSLNSRAALGAMLTGDIEPSVTLFSRAVEQLAAGGAGLGLVASVMMHMAYDRVAATAPIPMLSILDALADSATARGLGRLGVLGARPTVEGDFFARPFAAAGIALVRPEEVDRAWVHEIY